MFLLFIIRSVVLKMRCGTKWGTPNTRLNETPIETATMNHFIQKGKGHRPLCPRPIYAHYTLLHNLAVSLWLQRLLTTLLSSLLLSLASLVCSFLSMCKYLYDIALLNACTCRYL